MKKILNLYKSKNFLFLGVLVLSCSALISVFIPLFVKKLIESNDVLAEIIKLFGLIILQTVLLSVGNYVISKNGELSITNFMKKSIHHILDVPVSYFENEKSGGVAHKLIESFDDLRKFTSTTLPNFISSVIIILGSIVILFVLDWKLSLVLLLSLTVLIILLSVLSSFSSKYTNILKTNNGYLSGKLSEFIQQIRLIKFSNAKEDVKGNINNEIEENSRTSIKMSLVDSIVQPVTMLFFFVVIIGIFSYGAIRIKDGDLTLSLLISFLIYLIQLLTPFSQVGMFFNELSKIKVSLNYLDEINEVATEQGEDKVDNVVTLNNPELLEINNLSFGYADKNVLNNISMEFRRGEKVAIVGPSGSGKSTLLRILERLYSNYDGSILVDGKNINNINVSSWRDLLSVVDQDTALLSISIKDNLLLGIKDKNNLNLESALRKADLLEVVNNTESGLDTEIGERGIKLSGGQQQRLQIARAFLKDAPILLMDEPTSNLDSETEKNITNVVNELMADKISIVVAHRLSTIMDADKIYFVDNGEITGVGKHTELIEKHEKYKKFVNDQAIK